MAMKLSEHGGRLVCQKDSSLAGARGVSVGIHFQRKILTGLFGGEGFIMQKLEGDGWVFVHAGGTVMERQLAAGERIDVDTGCVVAAAVWLFRNRLKGERHEASAGLAGFGLLKRPRFGFGEIGRGHV